MMFLLLAIIAAVSSQPISVWRGGDDGLTLRFTEAYERDVSRLRTSKPLKVLIKQVTPISASVSRVVVKFERNGDSVSKLTCDFSRDAFQRCVRLAVKRTHALTAR
jgi:hypothetical protein